jgi:replicative DNA helicase
MREIPSDLTTEQLIIGALMLSARQVSGVVELSKHYKVYHRLKEQFLEEELRLIDQGLRDGDLLIVTMNLDKAELNDKFRVRELNSFEKAVRQIYGGE